MAEDSDVDVTDGTISGLSADDLKPNVYEGGFKIWECAVDLATFLLDEPSVLDRHKEAINIIEVRLLLQLFTNDLLASSTFLRESC